MMRKLLPVTAFMASLAPAAGHAQVIEIDSSGQAQTFDGPTLFTETEAVSLRPHRGALVAGGDPAVLIEQAARVHQIDPALLRAVAWQESRGRMSAVSSKGALGVMQLMPSTAAELGVDPGVMADNIRGGALYLRRQIDRFGTVPLALAAYNAGPGAVLRFGGIPPYRETQNYVATIMGRWRPLVLARPINSVIVEVTK
ncbi:MAG: lytic transglycosylase domain-containing protein [Sphingomonas sp.]|uniref:lytic transglycosylase domain-containing protein n=1 Tax=Sphingomonas sp. TaxID=28214 RepID=UPI0017E49E9B|nr:lytic transglycosylase domain-containing protein [Sphingomonas sp.]MBA3667385.1 lytic transglycosylase domain-containing protein [Sphingomonas sp.]